MVTVSPASTSPNDPEHPADRKGNARLIAVGAAAVLLVWFAVRNLGSVTIEFWVVDRKAPLILVIVISGLLGALIAALVGRHRSRRD
jgi:uncharacterized integral membrane protein